MHAESETGRHGARALEEFRCRHQHTLAIANHDAHAHARAACQWSQEYALGAALELHLFHNRLDDQHAAIGRTRIPGRQ
ncbi:hypothetical protein D3C71_2041460 [compost metagenome]